MCLFMTNHSESRTDQENISPMKVHPIQKRGPVRGRLLTRFRSDIFTFSGNSQGNEFRKLHVQRALDSQGIRHKDEGNDFQEEESVTTPPLPLRPRGGIGLTGEQPLTGSTAVVGGVKDVLRVHGGDGGEPTCESAVTLGQHPSDCHTISIRRFP